MRERPFAIPFALDDREPLLLSPDKSPDLRNVRSDRERIAGGPGAQSLGISLSSPGVFRSLAHVAFANTNQALIILTTTKAYGFNSLPIGSESYALTNFGGYYPRFAIANSNGLAAWTAAGHGSVSPVVVDVRTYDGSTVTVGSPAYAGRYMIAFNNRLLLAHTVETAAFFPNRLRWCQSGSYNSWGGIGSGFLDVVGNKSGGAITGLMQLADRAFLAMEREIHEILATGQTSPVHAVEPRVLGTGLVAPYTWAATEYFGFFVGSDSVYRWDGAQLTDIGGPVYKTLSGMLTGARRMTAQGVINSREQEYWITIAEDDMDNVFIYDFRRDRWYRDKYPQQVISMAGVMGQQDPFVGLNALPQSTVVFATATDVLKSVPGRTTFGTDTMDRYVTTQDYSAARIVGGEITPTINKVNTCYQVRFRGAANMSTEVGVSIDRGVTWQTSTVTTDAHGIGVAWPQQPFEHIRFRFRRQSSLAPLLELEGFGSFGWTESGVHL